jgi:hypothetical protein
MMAWTIVAWIIDAGLLLYAGLVIRYRLQILENRGWHGIPSVIALAVVLLASLIGSAMLVWLSGERWARIAALVVEGGAPVAGALAVVGMLVAGVALTIIDGGKFH